MPDAQTIRRYLDGLAIDPRQPQTWQVFPDRKDGKARPEHRCLRLQDALRWMADAQDAGGGVFLTVNATNGGRKAADVVGVRCLFVDVDTEQPEPTWHLEPAVVVQSSPGKWHAYWRVADHMPLEVPRRFGLWRIDVDEQAAHADHVRSLAPAVGGVDR